MHSRLQAVLSLVVAATMPMLALAAPARADATTTPACAEVGTTTSPTTVISSVTPTMPSASAGNPCWNDFDTDTEQYPFGYDGNPVDPTSPYCETFAEAGSPDPCYLVVDSMAFRAWNRGLAAVSEPAGLGLSTAYGVWRYNGTRWYPDPTFPGSTVCPGTTILAAGKLDAWLIGGGGSGAWPALCHFDGATDQWEPLPVPAATIAETAGISAEGEQAITSGSCFAYDNCWFFGYGGAVVHWDGQTLSNVSVGLGPSSWLTSTFTAATATTGAQGKSVGFAVTSFDPNPGDVQPDGAPPPQLFSSTGGQFSPLAFSPPGQGSASPSGYSAYAGTDLDAIAFDGQGDGWIAGNPAAVLTNDQPTLSNPFPSQRYAGTAPLLPISSDGTAESCPAANDFPYVDTGERTPSYLWSSVAVMPGGDAVAGGLISEKATTRSAVTYQPVLAQVSCDGAPQVTWFPTPAGSSLDALDASGYITAVAAPASNDAWASSTPGNGSAGWEPPQLYQWTDGQIPDAPAGNDDEPRPVVSTPEPTIFEIAPSVVDTTTTITTTTTSKQGKTRVKKITLKPAIFDIAKPKVVAAGHRLYTLSLTFRVRRKVRLGLVATRRGKVVSSSGIKTFKGRSGTLAVTLSPKAWPTGLRFAILSSKSK